MAWYYFNLQQLFHHKIMTDGVAIITGMFIRTIAGLAGVLSE